MKRLALLSLLVLVLAPTAGACVAAGHGGVNACPGGPTGDSSQHCFVGKQRPTPYVDLGGGQGRSYALETNASIQPTFWPSLVAPCTGKAISAWAMSLGSTVTPDNNYQLVQVGLWMDCNWNGSAYYFQTWHDGYDTACSPQPDCRWHNSLLSVWTSGAHNFDVKRTAGTNNFRTYIDGVAYWPQITLTGSYARQAIQMEDTVTGTGATCNRAHFRIGANNIGPPGQPYNFPWSEQAGLADPGLHFWNESSTSATDWFDLADWAS